MTRPWVVRRSEFFSLHCKADIRHCAHQGDRKGRIPAKYCPTKSNCNFLQDQVLQAIAGLLPNVAHGLQ